MAMACKFGPAAYDLATFLKQRDSSTVVLLAKVESAESVALSEFDMRQDLILNVRKRWLGPNLETLSAQGYIILKERTDCDSSFAFSVKADELWLIVGSVDQRGVVHPSKMLSRPVLNGNIPDEILTLLNTLEK